MSGQGSKLTFRLIGSRNKARQLQAQTLPTYWPTGAAISHASVVCREFCKSHNVQWPMQTRFYDSAILSDYVGVFSLSQLV